MKIRPNRSGKRTVRPINKRRRLRILIAANVLIYLAVGYITIYTIRDLADVDMPVPLPPRISTVISAVQGGASDDEGGLPAPGEYIPGDGSPQASGTAIPLPTLPVPPAIDPVKSADLRSSLEEMGLYVAAGLETKAPELRGFREGEAPASFVLMGSTRPESPFDMRLRITGEGNDRAACVRGRSPDAGTWFYLYPPGELTTQPPSNRCP